MKNGIKESIWLEAYYFYSIYFVIKKKFFKKFSLTIFLFGTKWVDIKYISYITML